MATSYAGPVVWALIVVIGGLTFLIRLSFIGLFGYLDEIPPRVKHGLRFVPAAVLAALVLPSFTAGIVAGGVAWRTEDVLMTIGAGMATLWVVRFGLLPAI